MKGVFDRVSPAQFAEKVGIPPAWLVVSWRWMPGKSERRRQHGKWYKIRSPDAAIYRVLRFSSNLGGGPKQGTGDIVLDWPGWIELSDFAEDTSLRLELELTPVSWWEYPRCAISHPDPTHRLAGELAVLSVALGLLSVLLAFALS